MFGVAPAILKEQLDDQLDKIIPSTSPERLMAERCSYGGGVSRYKSSVGSRDRSEESNNHQGRPTAYNEEHM